MRGQNYREGLNPPPLVPKQILGRKIFKRVGMWGNLSYKFIYIGFWDVPKIACISLKILVGPPGFEPGTSCTPSKRATRLRYGPTLELYR